MVSAAQAIDLSRSLKDTCIEHDTSAMGGGVTYYYQGREIRPAFLASWARKASDEARKPWVADGATISVSLPRFKPGKVALTIDGATSIYSLEEIDRAGSHRNAAWREIARRARVLL